MGGGEGPDTEEESGDGKKEESEDSEAASVNVETFSGSEQVNDDVFAQWKYNPSNKSGDKLVISLEYVGSDFSSPLSVTWAYGFEQKLGYHGGNGRGCFSISPETTG